MVELIVGIALIAVVGFGAWYVGKHGSKTTIASTSTTTTKTVAKAATPADPYAGWKTYCYTTYKYCFRYPTSWSITAPELGDVILANSAKTVTVMFGSENLDGATLSFNTTSITASPSVDGLSIIGGYFASSRVSGNFYDSGYYVTGASTLATYPLTVGTSSTFVNHPTFGSNQLQFTSEPTVVGELTTTKEAVAWFSDGDVQTSLSILKSLYAQ